MDGLTAALENLSEARRYSLHNSTRVRNAGS